jgi:thioredoxin-like negative regulator of GroEL
MEKISNDELSSFLVVQTLMEQKKMAMALDTAKMAVKDHPLSDRLNLCLIQLLLSNGDVVSASSHLEKYMSNKKGKDAGLLSLQMWLYHELKDHDKLNATIKSAITLVNKVSNNQ